MSEDQDIVESISQIIQRWNEKKNKQKKYDKTKIGLESKLNTTQPFTRRENTMLDRMLRSNTSEDIE